MLVGEANMNKERIGLVTKIIIDLIPFKTQSDIDYYFSIMDFRE